MGPLELAELVAAARAVIQQRDACDGQDIIENIDPELNRLRKALP
jgi:hypothetical protein